MLCAIAIGEDGYHSSRVTVGCPDVIHLVVVEVEFAVAIHDCKTARFVVGGYYNECFGVPLLFLIIAITSSIVTGAC